MSTLAEQQGLYGTMKTYCLTNDLAMGTDYFLVGTVENITYWSPNDEDWGAIIAMDASNKLAIDTEFYEMDDMDYPDSDYAIVRDDGILKSRYETI